MASQPEVSNYDVGVYQLQTSDGVQGGLGGASNTPLLNLANRTNWLYTQLNLVISGATIPPTVAALLSPIFSGSPTSPTPALGDNSLKLATTAFVQGTVNGALSLSVAGGVNVSLSAVQAGNGILILSGALTANIAVIVPSASRKWIVQNLTTGAFTLTVKTACGGGIAITQGNTQTVWCDGISVFLASNDFPSVALLGTPTSPTPPVGDQSTRIATTGFAYTLKNGVVSVPVGGNVDVTLTPAQYGVGILLLTGVLTGPINLIVPAQGGTYVVANNTTGAFALNVGAGGAGTKALVPQGSSVVAYCDATNVVLAGAAATSSFSLYTFTATAGQTAFNAPYTPGNIVFMQNGAVLSPLNYTAINGANVTLNVGATLNDDVSIIAFASFTVANALLLAGGTMAGPIIHAGGDTGVTPAQFNNSTLLATTAWVTQLGNIASGVYPYNANTGIPGSAIGGLVYAYGSAALAFNLPGSAAFGIPVGAQITVLNAASLAMTLSSVGTDKINIGSVQTAAIIIQPNDTITLTWNATSWFASGGATMLTKSGLFASSIAAPGWQKLPSGLIIQWGSYTTSSQSIGVTFPLAFPSACLSLAMSGNTLTSAAMVGTTSISRTGFTAVSYASGGTYVAVTSSYIAIGF
jgi:hypothetical protein